MSNPRIDSSDDLRLAGDRLPRDQPRGLSRTIKLVVNSIKMHFDLVMEALRERRLLPVRCRITRIGIDESHQHRRVDTTRKMWRGLGGGKVDPVRNIAMVEGKVIFAVIDNRAIDNVAKQRRRPTSSAMGDDQVGLQVGSSTNRLVGSLAEFEIFGIDLRPGCRVTLAIFFGKRIALHVEALKHLGRRRRARRDRLDQEVAIPAVSAVQFECDVAELGGKCVVEKEDSQRFNLPGPPVD